ncbi:MAG TPA: hypothetical protein PKA64_26060, partial [Myxococcota bacterium]|nr:hypothetical protein [Myxococcota bacterium]
MILLAALLGCAPPAAPAPVVQAAPPPPPALPGSEALRVSVDRVDARQHFDSAAPFVWEFHVPPGVVIPGEGLPPDVGGTSDLAPWYRDEAQRSIVQLEVPASRTGLTDEEAEVGSNTNFDPARFCRVGDPACLWSDDDDGRWRAWRVRSEANQVTTTELQLAHTWLDPQGETPEAAWRIIGLWLDAGALPLDEYDRIRFEYVGSMPAKATTWLDHRPMRPRLRYRPAAGSPCPGSRYACWTLLDDSDVQPVEVLPGRARWLQIIAPLDTRAGVPFDVRLISLDEWSNPAPLDGYLQLQINGRPASGPIGGGGRWTATATLTARTPGMYMLSVNPPAGVTGIAQYTRVWDAAAMPYDRKIGDVHVHSGLDGSVAFDA